MVDPLGRRHDVLLGKHGTPASREAYARALAEWEASGRRLPSATAGADVTITELILAFSEHARQHYRHADGTPTGEEKEFKLSLRPLRALYGATLACKFGPLALEALRQAMVTGSYLTIEEKATRQASGHPLRLSRGVVNQRIGRIRRLFRWGAAKELVPASVYQALMTVTGLGRNRSEARETEPVKPVPLAVVQATLPYLLPTVADMVMVQLHTGMRPGEVCRMRLCDVDRTREIWEYRLDQHKTAHRGHARVVPIGPRAQAIIQQRLKPDAQAYLFSPRDTMAEKRERDRRARKTKIYASERSHKRARPKIQPGEYYTTTTFCIAVRRAVRKANAALVASGAKPDVPHWHPHQLRHTKDTEIRRMADLDAARAVLGHHSIAVTEDYAELDFQKAIEIAARLG